MNITQLYEDIQSFIFGFGPKILCAIAVWIVGSWIINLAIKALKKIFDRTKLDKSLKPFILSLSGITMKLLLAISVLGMLGVEMTSFIAILGAAGLAIEMALSGTLQNFAGGVKILVFKPFKVDDLIDTRWHIGVVKEILIFFYHIANSRKQDRYSAQWSCSKWRNN